MRLLKSTRNPRAESKSQPTPLCPFTPTSLLRLQATSKYESGDINYSKKMYPKYGTLTTISIHSIIIESFEPRYRETLREIFPSSLELNYSKSLAPNLLMIVEDYIDKVAKIIRCLYFTANKFTNISHSLTIPVRERIRGKKIR